MSNDKENAAQDDTMPRRSGRKIKEEKAKKDAAKDEHNRIEDYFSPPCSVIPSKNEEEKEKTRKNRRETREEKNEISCDQNNQKTADSAALLVVHQSSAENDENKKSMRRSRRKTSLEKTSTRKSLPDVAKEQNKLVETDNEQEQEQEQEEQIEERENEDESFAAVIQVQDKNNEAKVDSWLGKCPDSVSPVMSPALSKKEKKLFTSGRRERISNVVCNDLLASQDPYKFKASPPCGNKKQDSVELFKESEVAAGNTKRKSAESAAAAADNRTTRSKQKSANSGDRSTKRKSTSQSRENPQQEKAKISLSNRTKSRLTDDVRITVVTDTADKTSTDLSSMIEKISQAEEHDLLLSQQFREEEKLARSKARSEAQPEARSEASNKEKQENNKQESMEREEKFDKENEGRSESAKKQQQERDDDEGLCVQQQERDDDEGLCVQQDHVKLSLPAADKDGQDEIKPTSESQNIESLPSDKITNEAHSNFAKKYARPDRKSKKRSSNEKLKLQIVEKKSVEKCVLRSKGPDVSTDWAAEDTMRQELMQNKKTTKLQISEGMYP